MTSTATIAPTTPTAELVLQLHQLTAVQRQVFRAALVDLGAPGIAALGAVHRDGPMRVSALAAHLAVDLSVASRQAGGLVAAGHLRRELDPTDRRAQLVAITDAGVALLEAAHSRLVDTVEDVLGDWSPADVATLTAGLSRLRADLQRKDRR